jgi:hypothetical protein
MELNRRDRDLGERRGSQGSTSLSVTPIVDRVGYGVGGLVRSMICGSQVDNDGGLELKVGLRMRMKLDSESII